MAITVPGRTDLDAVAARLKGSGLPFADDGRSLTVNDPWGTKVTLSLPGATVAEVLGSVISARAGAAFCFMAHTGSGEPVAGS